MTALAIVDQPALIVGEAHHRFANSLQLILSATNGILRDGGCDPHACERLYALQERIAALAEVNRSLCGPYGPETLTAEALEDLCANIAASFERTGALICIDVVAFPDRIDTCRTLLLLVSEFAINALKHGRHRSRLRLDILLCAIETGFRLVVRSNTAGLYTAAARPRIAEELAHAAGGTLDTLVEGDEYCVSVIIPASNIPAR